MLRKLKHILRGRGGATLLESVLALLYFAVAITAVSGMFGAAARIALNARRDNAAVEAVIAQSEQDGYNQSAAAADIRQLTTADGSVRMSTASVNLRVVAYTQDIEGKNSQVKLYKFVYVPGD